MDIEGDQVSMDPLALIHQVIGNARMAVDDELAHKRQGSTDDWLTCLGTRIGEINYLLYLAEQQKQITSEERQLYRDRQKLLTQDIAVFRKSNQGDPSEEEKQKFIKKLNIFEDPKEQSPE